MSIGQDSRNNLTKIVAVVDPTTGYLTKPAFLDLRPRVTETADDDILITTDASQQWPHIGLKYLGNARGWWAIADLSNVVDPFVDLEPGVTLRVPSLQRYLFRMTAPTE